MVLKNNKNLFFSFGLFLVVTIAGFSLLFIDHALATCPSSTTVDGTKVNFVGELTDMGGEKTTSVWFEYGKTADYGEKTAKKTLTSPKIYCFEVSGLSPSTVYQYRAVAENSAGIAYGANRSFTTGSQDSAGSVFSMKKTVRNLSKSTAFLESVSAEPGEVLVFGIVVRAGNNTINNVTVKDSLPAGLIYDGDLRVDNVLTQGNIITGLNIGSISANQKKTVTFRAKVAGADNFDFGQTKLNNSASVSVGDKSLSDNVEIIVTRSAVAGAVTQVPTGLTNNIFLDSFLLPLISALFIVWIFKSRIVNFEKWLDFRKKQYQTYKSNKTLQVEVSKIKARDFLRKKII